MDAIDSTEAVDTFVMGIGATLAMGICAGACITIAINYFRLNKKIEELGDIQCDRCNYRGKASGGGTLTVMFKMLRPKSKLPTKMFCPACHSDKWEKVQ